MPYRRCSQGVSVLRHAQRAEQLYAKHGKNDNCHGRKENDVEHGWYAGNERLEDEAQLAALEDEDSRPQDASHAERTVRSESNNHVEGHGLRYGQRR